MAAGALLVPRSLPSLETLERIEPNLITKVYDKDTKPSSTSSSPSAASGRPAENIPKAQKLAVFAIEDQKFHQHWGVDVAAYPSALLPALMGKRARGASTITQQLAKNLFLNPERSIVRKIKEILVAVQIEQTYTKNEILEFYFNQVYLGGGGVRVRRRRATLFLQAARFPGHQPIRPARRPAAAARSVPPGRQSGPPRDRRNTVLGAMKSSGYITRDQYKEASKSGLEREDVAAPQRLRRLFRRNRPAVHGKGVERGPHLQPGRQRLHHPGFLPTGVAESTTVANLNRARVRLRYRTARAFNMAGLMKQPLDSIVRHWDITYPRFDSMYLRKGDTTAEYQKRFPDSLRYVHAQTAFLILDNETGAVRAMVGGEHFDKSKYNRAVQAVRSPGSAFKPFVYATAVDNGASPGDILNDQPITIPDPMDSTKFWRPHNFDPGFDGKISMRRALYKSKNLPAIEVGMKYGLKTGGFLRAQVRAHPQRAAGALPGHRFLRGHPAGDGFGLYRLPQRRRASQALPDREDRGQERPAHLRERAQHPRGAPQGGRLDHVHHAAGREHQRHGGVHLGQRLQPSLAAARPAPPTTTTTPGTSASPSA